jgi:hypothetical protein
VVPTCGRSSPAGVDGYNSPRLEATTSYRPGAEGHPSNVRRPCPAQSLTAWHCLRVVQVRRPLTMPPLAGTCRPPAVKSPTGYRACWAPYQRPFDACPHQSWPAQTAARLEVSQIRHPITSSSCLACHPHPSVQPSIRSLLAKSSRRRPSSPINYPGSCPRVCCIFTRTPVCPSVRSPVYFHLRLSVVFYSPSATSSPFSLNPMRFASALAAATVNAALRTYISLPRRT